MDNINSVLVLKKLVYDKIEFNRKGFRCDSDLEFQFEVQIGKDSDIYKVTLILKAEKPNEYDFLISLSGFFVVEQNDELTKEDLSELISKNAVSILMPYLRSEASILTAQPDTECIVLPPFDINKLLDEKNRNRNKS